MDWTLQDAKNKFSAVVDAAVQHHPQFVTRRGKPAVVVLATSEYERLRKLEAKAKPSFKAFLRQGPEPFDEEERRFDVNLREIDF